VLPMNSNYRPCYKNMLKKSNSTLLLICYAGNNKIEEYRLKIFTKMSMSIAGDVIILNAISKI
ncbi:MAG TPA: hypothetical protein PLX22_09575, partial [Spirochaetota bacterium]|nr:hypothetical protein [Spirochaetota bacterium]